jgi:hypothetical protein
MSDLNQTRALITLTDDSSGTPVPYGRLEFETGKLYSMSGEYQRTLEVQGAGNQGDSAQLARAGIHDPIELHQALSLRAANYDIDRRGHALRKKLALKDHGRHGGTKVLMDLSQTDVHIPSAMPNFAGGYHLEDGVADIAMPIVPALKQSDKFFIWNSGNAFTPPAAGMSGPGGGPPEISPALSNYTYNALEYALGSFVPTEVEANADAPLQPYQAAVDLVMTKLRLIREMRAAAVLTTAVNWSANNVLALAAGAQWNGGGAGDPVANIQFIQEHSAARVTRIVMGAPVFHALQRSPAVRQYHFAKDGDPALPNAQELSRVLELPPIVVAEMKYFNPSSVLTYVWPSVAGSLSSCVFLHEPAQNPPTDQRDNATAYTFRWTGASAPDGTLTGGFLVRSYYDPKRNARGGRVVVVVHNDAEVLTGSILGGLVTGCIQ